MVEILDANGSPCGPEEEGESFLTGDFNLEAIELGSLPRNPITGKVNRLRDLRVVSPHPLSTME